MGGVIWIDGIEQDEKRQWQARVYERKHIRVVSCRQSFEALPKVIVDVSDRWLIKCQTCNVPFSFKDMSQAKRLLYPKDLISRFTRDLSISEQHAIYKIRDNEQTYFIPALLLIKMLFGGNRVFERNMLLPGGADLLGAARVETDRIRITTHRSIQDPDMTKRYARILAWLLTNDEAKRAHASILQYARDGEIALKVPPVRLSGWIRGIVMVEGIFVVAMDGIDIQLPLEKEKIMIDACGKVKHFKSYEPRVLSPWGKMKQVRDE